MKLGLASSTLARKAISVICNVARSMINPCGDTHYFVHYSMSEICRVKGTGRAFVFEVNKNENKAKKKDIAEFYVTR